MITTSTHDTKRSEDVRARLAVLSEVPDAWRAAVEVFTRRAAELAGAAPEGEADRDPVIEYLLHQTNVGAHPLGADRAVQHARKAAREAKRSTSWLHPDEEYEQRLFAAVEAWSEDAEYQGALTELLAVIERPGRVNGLGLKLLALTLPGVPDIYQGSELWTGDIVDPDNRRPVDFELRRRLAAAGPSASGLDLDDEGSGKLHLIRAALAVRREHPAAFAPETGTYEPLHADGVGREHVVAFAAAVRWSPPSPACRAVSSEAVGGTPAGSPCRQGGGPTSCPVMVTRGRSPSPTSSSSTPSRCSSAPRNRLLSEGARRISVRVPARCCEAAAMPELDLRATAPEEHRAACDTMRAALLTGPISDDEWERAADSWTNSMSLTAWDGARCVGHVGAFRFDTLVPGGARLPTAARHPCRDPADPHPSRASSRG